MYFLYSFEIIIYLIFSTKKEMGSLMSQMTALYKCDVRILVINEKINTFRKALFVYLFIHHGLYKIKLLFYCEQAVVAVNKI